MAPKTQTIYQLHIMGHHAATFDTEFNQVTPKLRPGWSYDEQGRPQQGTQPDRPAPKRPAKYNKQSRNPAPPSTRMVLDCQVKLTPRRRELLMAIMHDQIAWREIPDWSRLYVRGYMSWATFFDGHDVTGTLTTLRQLRLIRWRRELQQIMITPRGVQAAMEACDYEDTREKRRRSNGASR